MENELINFLKARLKDARIVKSATWDAYSDEPVGSVVKKPLKLKWAKACERVRKITTAIDVLENYCPYTPHKETAEKG